MSALSRVLGCFLIPFATFSFAQPNFQCPVDDCSSFSRGFEERLITAQGAKGLHNGIDFALPEGSRVYAIGDGEVYFSDESASRGLAVFIDHKNGYRSESIYLSKLTVIEGQQVKAGDLIGYSGRSFRYDISIMHLTLLKGDRAIDPAPFIPIRTKN